MRVVLFGVWLTVAMLLLALSFAPEEAKAHVLVTSRSGEATAVVHINPDDDPIAGSEASVYLDVKSGQLVNSEVDYIIRISKESEGNVDSVVATELGVSGVRFEYVFPVRGIYKLEIIALTDDGLVDGFEFAQNVSRGIGTMASKRYGLAEFGIILSSCLIAVILIIVINRRSLLVRYAKARL